MSRIYLSPPHMSGVERELVAEVFESNFIAPVGPQITAFEEEMAETLGRGYAVALASGTAALHLAMEMLELKPGDEVLCSDLTFVASVNPVRYAGATPVFVDAEASSWTMDPELVEEFLKKRAAEGRLPKAMIPVHLYGQPADLRRLHALCQEYGLELVEDAAESLGATARPPRGMEGGATMTGGFGRFGALSFNGNKIITAGGGGMLICRRAADAERARFLATQARDPAPHYQHSVMGYNYRMSNVLAAIGRGQLRSLTSRVRARRAVFEGYRRRLADLPGVAFMPEAEYGLSNRWLSCVLFGEAGQPEEGRELREAVRLALEAEDIESRPVWKPMHMQPLWQDAECLGGKVGEDLFARGLCLPSGTALSEEDQDRVCDIIRRTLA